MDSRINSILRHYFLHALNVVVVHAKGVVKETQKTFWSTKDPGQKPFEYTAGVGGVITGASRASSSLENRALARPRRATPHD